VPRLPLIPRHRAAPELRAAYDRVSRAWGMKATPVMAMQIMQCFSVRPDYVEPAGMGYFYAGWAARTPRHVLELVAVLVSKHNDCFY
jgi:hypothetical protein